MRATVIGMTVCAILSGCALHRIPEPLQRSYVWDDSAKPVNPLRADSVKASALVVDYAEQVGLITQADCEWSRRAFEVITSQTDQAFQVTLVRRPGWCRPDSEGTLPPRGNGIDEGGFEWAVRRSDLRLLRERANSDPYLLKGRLYGAQASAGESVTQSEKQTDAHKETEAPAAEGSRPRATEQSEQIAKQWEERFSSRSAQAQEAFRTRKFIPGMSREEFDLLMEYRRAQGEQLELKRVGESEEIGKKKDTWLYCQPDCEHRASAPGIFTFENDVLTLVQTGWVTP